MPQYLTQVAYTDESWQSMMSAPQDRFNLLRPVYEKLGGRIIDAWFTFGDYDVVVIGEFPDNTTAAALAIAVSASGACKSIKTTPLIEAAEGMAAMRKAATCGYKSPVVAKGCVAKP